MFRIAGRRRKHGSDLFRTLQVLVTGQLNTPLLPYVLTTLL
ncbi:MAG: hypothetical protein ACKVHE_37420 [Planctomycetales bacterium]